MSLRDQAWWPEFCARLRNEPLDQLSRAYGQSTQALCVALNLGDDGGPATEAAWWPEAVRRYKAGDSLREISRIFGVNLRRLRRGLARAGLRAAGEDLGQEGVSALTELRDQLGKVPDGVLAEKAGVTVEAVQGERRRLNIPPYRNAGAPSAPEAVAPLPAPAPAPAPVVEAKPAAPIEAPQPPPPAPRAPIRAQPEAGGATTIRRVVLTATAQSDAPPPARAPTPTRREELRREGFGRDDARRDDPRRDDARRGARDWRDEPSARTGPTLTSRNTFRREASEPTVVRRPSSGGRIAAMGRGELPPSEDNALGRGDYGAEPADDGSGGTLAARERRGRLRLIRPDAIQPEPIPEPEAPKPRRRKEPTYSPVRNLTPDEVDLSELALEPSSRVDSEPRAEDERRAAPTPEPEALPLFLESLPPDAETRELERAQEERAQEERAQEEREEEAREVAAQDEPATTPVSIRPVRAPRAPRPRPTPPPVAAAPRPVVEAPARAVAPTPVVAPPQAPVLAARPAAAAPLSARARGWLVKVEGRAAPLVILAEDVATAALRASLELSPEDMGRASIVCVDML